MSKEKGSWGGCLLEIIVIAIIISFFTDFCFQQVFMGIIGIVGVIIGFAGLWVLGIIVFAIAAGIIGIISGYLTIKFKGYDLYDWRTTIWGWAVAGVVGAFSLSILLLILKTVELIGDATLDKFIPIVFISGAISGGWYKELD